MNTLSQMIDHSANLERVADRLKKSTSDEGRKRLKRLIKQLLLCRMYLKKNVDYGYDNRCTFDEFKKGLEFVKEHFIALMPETDKETGITSLPTLKWLNEKIAFSKMKHGVNAYIKDPWNMIWHDYHGREDEYLSRVLSEEMFFAADYDAACYVAHPRTLRKNKAGKYEAPTEYEISGGAMFFNKVDNMFVIHRPNYDDSPTDRMVEIRQRKVRKRKRVGDPKTHQMIFDPATNTYKDEFNNPRDNWVVPNEFTRAENVKQHNVKQEEGLPF